MRHCFDYLRQSLICAADTTMEPVITELGGVTGWNALRTCRSYDQLKSWAEKWRVSNLEGFGDQHHEH
ncbi:Tat pathway signal sequence protein [Rutstroemia sp. NJR-2017a BBW]|nr:Tat pathway signal sequence protein [Rutstroemia sp. NJR-2017a BBW]